MTLKYFTMNNDRHFDRLEDETCASEKMNDAQVNYENAQVNVQVEDQKAAVNLEEKVVTFCSEPKSLIEICVYLGFKDRRTVRKILIPLIYVNAYEDYLTMKKELNDREKLLAIRENTGMNRKQFAEYFDIPYMSLSDWERGKGRVPAYLPRLLEYYVRMHKITDSRKGDNNCD